MAQDMDRQCASSPAGPLHLLQQSPGNLQLDASNAAAASPVVFEASHGKSLKLAHKHNSTGSKQSQRSQQTHSSWRARAVPVEARESLDAKRVLFAKYFVSDAPAWQIGIQGANCSSHCRSPSLKGSTTGSPARKAAMSPHQAVSPASPFAITPLQPSLSLGLAGPSLKQGDGQACWPLGMGQRSSPAHVLSSPPHAAPVMQQQRKQLKKLCRKLCAEEASDVHATQGQEQQKQWCGGLGGIGSASLSNIARLVEVPELAVQACQMLIATSKAAHCRRPQELVLDALVPVLVSSLPVALGGSGASLLPCTLAGGAQQKSAVPEISAAGVWQQVSILRPVSARLAALGVLVEMTRSNAGCAAVTASSRLMQLLGVYLEVEQAELPCKLMAAHVCHHLTQHNTGCQRLCKDGQLLRQLRTATTYTMRGWVAHCTQYEKSGSGCDAAAGNGAREGSIKAMDHQAMRLLKALTGAMCACIQADPAVAHSLMHVPFRHNAPRPSSKITQAKPESRSHDQWVIKASYPEGETTDVMASWYKSVPDELHTTASTRVVTAAVQLLLQGVASSSPIAGEAASAALKLLACMAVNSPTDDSSRLRDLIQAITSTAAITQVNMPHTPCDPCMAAALHMLDQPHLSVATRAHAMQLMWLLSQGHVHDSSSNTLVQKQLGACSEALHLCTQPIHLHSHTPELRQHPSRTAATDVSTRQQALGSSSDEQRSTSTSKHIDGSGRSSHSSQASSSSDSSSSSSDSSSSSSHSNPNSIASSQSDSSSDSNSSSEDSSSNSFSSDESSSESERQLPGEWVMEDVEMSAAATASTELDVKAAADDVPTTAARLEVEADRSTDEPAAHDLQHAKTVEQQLTTVGARACPPGQAATNTARHYQHRRHQEEVMQLRSSTLALLSHIASCPGCVLDATNSPSGSAASLDSILSTQILPLLQGLTTDKHTTAATVGVDASDAGHACGGAVSTTAGAKQLHLQRQALVLLSNLCVHPQYAQFDSARVGACMALQVLQTQVVDQVQTSCASDGIRHGKPSAHGMLEVSYDQLLATLVEPAATVLANWWHHQAQQQAGSSPSRIGDKLGCDSEYGVDGTCHKDGRISSYQEAARVLCAVISKLLPSAQAAKEVPVQHRPVLRRPPASSPAKPTPKPTTLPQHLSMQRLKTLLPVLRALGHVGTCVLGMQQQQQLIQVQVAAACTPGVNADVQDATSQSSEQEADSDEKQFEKQAGHDQAGQDSRRQEEGCTLSHNKTTNSLDSTVHAQSCTTEAYQCLLPTELGLPLASTVSELLCACAAAVPLNQAGQLAVDTEPVIALLLDVMQAALSLLCVLVATGAAPPLPIARRLLPQLSVCLLAPCQQAPPWSVAFTRATGYAGDGQAAQDQGCSRTGCSMDAQLFALRAHALAWLQLSCSLTEVASLVVQDTSLVPALMQLLHVARLSIDNDAQSTVLQLQTVLSLLKPFDRYHMRAMEALHL